MTGGVLSSEARTRRQFVAALPGVCAAVLVGVRPVYARPVRRVVAAGKHPEPRPGIDASRVLARDSVPPDAAAVYDMVREMPQIVDGIHCYCGCADIPDYYSLLTCYESGGMAQACKICQGQAKVAHRLHRSGKSLNQIRDAIDAEFG